LFSTPMGKLSYDDKLRIRTFREQGLMQNPSSPVSLIIKSGN